MNKISFLSFLMILLLLVSCSGNPKTISDTDFNVNGFSAEGISEYFMNPSGTDKVSFKADYSAERSADDNGRLSVVADFSDYPYGDHTVTGKFIYTVPVESGKILGYRIETADGSTPVFTDGSTGKETTFSVSMDESSLAPAGGNYDAATDTVSGGIAAPMLSGTKASFTINNESFSIEDISPEEAPYSRNMLAEDLYSMMLANGPLSAYAKGKLMEQMTSASDQYSVDLGNGNIYSMSFDEQTGTGVVSMRIINPMDFLAEDSRGNTFSVHTAGSVIVESESTETKATGSVVCNDFVSTIIMTGNGEPEVIQSKKISGAYTLDIYGSEIVNGSITIGNHTYTGNEYRELVGLYALEMTVSQFWGFSEFEDDGKYINTLGVSDDPMIYIEGNYDDSTDVLDADIILFGESIPFRAVVDISESGTGSFKALTYDGIEFSDDEIGYINAIYDLTYAFMSSFV